MWKWSLYGQANGSYELKYYEIIEYDADDDRVRTTHYNSDDKVDGYTRYENGLRIELIQFGINEYGEPDESIISLRTEYFYDDEDNLLYSLDTYSEGNVHRIDY